MPDCTRVVRQKLLLAAEQPLSSVNSLVPFQVALLCEPFPAVRAVIGPLAGVNPAVCFQVAQLGEAPPTQRAAKWPLARVSLLVCLQVREMGEGLPTLRAAVHCPLHVGPQVGPHTDERTAALPKMYGPQPPLPREGPRVRLRVLRGHESLAVRAAHASVCSGRTVSDSCCPVSHSGLGVSS